jgi:hypothetical protein
MRAAQVQDAKERTCTNTEAIDSPAHRLNAVHRKDWADVVADVPPGSVETPYQIPRSLTAWHAAFRSRFMMALEGCHLTQS